MGKVYSNYKFMDIWLMKKFKDCKMNDKILKFKTINRHYPYLYSIMFKIPHYNLGEFSITNNFCVLFQNENKYFITIGITLFKDSNESFFYTLICNEQDFNKNYVRTRVVNDKKKFDPMKNTSR
ncbi:hypothetical protein A3Q56_05268 [Intoshia linei]|uniref:Uncharacterized protein n=1 Tax=Intoshia linei TaxID=1819745 RepID=A0A177AYA4_9BILA|nr:hypothetical protein A3Q56_05268 [Intoshia linei]